MSRGIKEWNRLLEEISGFKKCSSEIFFHGVPKSDLTLVVEQTTDPTYSYYKHLQRKLMDSDGLRDTMIYLDAPHHQLYSALEIETTSTDYLSEGSKEIQSKKQLYVVQSVQMLGWDDIERLCAPTTSRKHWQLIATINAQHFIKEESRWRSYGDLNIVHVPEFNHHLQEKLIKTKADFIGDQVIQDTLEENINELRALLYFTPGDVATADRLYDSIASGGRISINESVLQDYMLRHEDMYEARLISELSQQEREVFKSLALQEPITPADLSRNTAMVASSIRAHLSKLLTLGYVEKGPRYNKKTFYRVSNPLLRIFFWLKAKGSLPPNIAPLFQYFANSKKQEHEKKNEWEKNHQYVIAGEQDLIKSHEPRVKMEVVELSEDVDYVGNPSLSRMSKLKQEIKSSYTPDLSQRLESMYQEAPDKGLYAHASSLFLAQEVNNLSVSFSMCERAAQFLPNHIAALLNSAIVSDKLGYHMHSEYRIQQIFEVLSKAYALSDHQQIIDKIVRSERDIPAIRFACFFIARYGLVSYLDQLLDAIQKDTYTSKTKHFVLLLGQLGRPRVVSGLVRLLRHEAGDIRKAAAAALSYFPGAEPQEALISCLSDSSSRVVMEAVRTLGIIGDKSVWPDLFQLSKSSTSAILAQALLAAGNLQAHEAVGFLKDHLRHSSALIKSSAIEALSNLKDIDMADDLRRVGFTQSSVINVAQCRALAKCKTEESLPMLFAFLAADDTLTKVAAIEAFETINDRAAIGAVLPYIQSKEYLVRAASIRFLGCAEAEFSIDMIVPCLEDSNEIVRQSVLNALSHMIEHVKPNWLISNLNDQYWVNKMLVLELLIETQNNDEFSYEITSLLRDDAPEVRVKAASLMGQRPEITVIAQVANCLDSNGEPLYQAKLLRCLSKSPVAFPVEAILSFMESAHETLQIEGFKTLWQIDRVKALPLMRNWLYHSKETFRVLAGLWLLKCSKSLEKQEFAQLIRILLGWSKQLPSDLKTFCIENLLRTGFRMRDEEGLGQLINALEDVLPTSTYFEPYLIAYKYLKGELELGMLSSFQIEMQHAVNMIIALSSKPSEANAAVSQ